MTLIELLELIDENSFVTVKSTEIDKDIAKYDGRNSISNGLNRFAVLKIRGKIEIEIMEEI